jgi:glutaryl-CoA dehydrogenase
LLSDDERWSAIRPASSPKTNLIPIIEEFTTGQGLPRELVKPMADLGFFGASLKGLRMRRAFGTWNMAWCTQELERGDSGRAALSACSRRW